MSKNGIYSIIIFIAFTGIYYLGSFSKIPFGDAIGFVTTAEKREFVLSTNTYAHFLFSNISVLLQKLFPWIESREITRFLTITSASATLTVLFNLIFVLTRNLFPAVFGAIIFGFSYSFWKNAEIVEVYTLNLLAVAGFLFFAVRFLVDKRALWLYWSAILLGISLFSHIQNILLIPAFVVAIYFSEEKKSRLVSAALFLIFFLILIFIPVLRNEPVSGVFSASTGISQIDFSAIFNSLLMSFLYLIYNFWHFILFAIFGAVTFYKIRTQIFWFLIVAAIPVYGFSVVFNVSDHYVFFLPFNFIFAVFIGIGIYLTLNKKWTKKVAYTSLMMPLFYFFTLQIASSTQKGQDFQEKKAYKGGLKYYLLPWMNNNVGILEFTIEKRTATEQMDWMERGAEEFTEIKKSKGYSPEQIKKL